VLCCFFVGVSLCGGGLFLGMMFVGLVVVLVGWLCGVGFYFLWGLVACFFVFFFFVLLVCLWVCFLVFFFFCLFVFFFFFFFFFFCRRGPAKSGKEKASVARRGVKQPENER